MKLYRQLIQAVLEKIPGSVGGKLSGLIYYRTDTNKPYIDTGSGAGEGIKEIMVREELGGQVAGPYTTANPIKWNEGGLAPTAGAYLSAGLLPGNAGDVPTVNAGRNGFDFLPSGGAAALPNFAYYYIDTLESVTIPDGQVMYLINRSITVDGTLVVDGIFEELILDTESIGDIATSMLDEAQYQTEKGTGWVLADGRDVTGSYYAAITGSTTIPDLRGQFLRGKNNARSDGFEDVDGERALGAFQEDSLQYHNHWISYNSFDSTGGVGGLPRMPNRSGGFNGTDWYTGNGQGRSPLEAGRWSDETRPKNVAINYFIKIDY